MPAPTTQIRRRLLTLVGWLGIIMFARYSDPGFRGIIVIVAHYANVVFALVEWLAAGQPDFRVSGFHPFC